MTTPRLARTAPRPPASRRRVARRPSRRGGFTLVEILVVITIIAVLTAIVTVASVGFIGAAREAATRTTIKKVDEAVMERVGAVNRWHQRPINRLQHDWQFRGWDTEWTVAGLDVFASAGDRQSAQLILSRKGMLRESLPVYQPVRPEPGDDSKDGDVAMGELVRAYWFWARFDKDNNGALAAGERTGMYDWVTDSDTAKPGNQGLDRPGEVFYYALLNAPVFGGSRVVEDDFRQSELIDPDQDGFSELADSWGNPLRFYRWPTRLVNNYADPAGIDPVDPSTWTWGTNATATTARKTLMPNAPSAELDLLVDPDDRSGYLGQPRPLYLQSANQLMEMPATAFFHDPFTWHAPLIVSAGPDNQLGLDEPDVVKFFHPSIPLAGLAAPVAGQTEALFDNITNHAGRAGGPTR